MPSEFETNVDNSTNRLLARSCLYWNVRFLSRIPKIPPPCRLDPVLGTIAHGLRAWAKAFRPSGWFLEFSGDIPPTFKNKQCKAKKHHSAR